MASAARATLLAAVALLLSSVQRARADPDRVAAASPIPPARDVSGKTSVYVSGPNCPGESEFWVLVASHLRSRSALNALPERVEVFELGGEAIARVVFGASSGASATRELSAATCREAAEAAALVVALALDAPLQEVPATTPSPVAPAEVRQLVPPSSPLRDSARPMPPRASGPFLAFGAGAFAQQAVAPSPLLGVSGFAGIGDRESAAEVRLGVVFARSGTTKNGDAAAEFTLLAGQAEACAFAFVHGERFLVDPCLALEIGRIESQGVDSERYAGKGKASAWGAFGPLLRARYGFSALGLEAYAGPWIPVVGPRQFVFEDPQGNHSFHHMAAVGLVGGVAMALRLD